MTEKEKQTILDALAVYEYRIKHDKNITETSIFQELLQNIAKAKEAINKQ